jgi:hypothetical protein
MRTEASIRLMTLLAAGLIALGATGCPGTLADKERFLTDAAVVDTGGADPCGDVPTRILAAQCGGTGCHGPMAPQQGLDLESPDVAARVVGVAATSCAATLADPANPSVSFLYTKLAVKPPCGSQMPLARPPLSSADAACVLAWIAAQ